jgi:O-antigen/teichoic acid export membrane protein
VRLFALALLPRFWQQWAMASEAGLLRYDWQARIEGAGYFLLSVGVVSLAWAGQSLQVLAVWYMVATIATLLSHLLFLKQAWQRLSLKPTYSPVSVGQLYRFGLSQWISNIGGLLFSQADRILVNVLLGPGPVGLYAVATSVAVRINEFSAVPIQSIAPMISTIAASGQSSRLVHVFKRALRLNALIVYLVSIAVMLWAKPIAILLASPEHSQTIVSLFQILVPIYAVYSLNAPGYFAAIGLQRPRINAVYVLPSGILTLLLMVWLIPSFHLVGVVLGNSGYILTLAINLKVARDIGLGVKGYIEEIIPFIGSLLIGCGLSWANVILADPSYLTTALFFVLSATLALWIDNQSVVDTFQLIVGQTQRWLAVIRRV